MKYDFILYTDGGYSRVNDCGAFAYIMLDGDGSELKSFAKKIDHETNNRAELKAIIAGLYHIPKDNAKVLVKSDSQYALYTCKGDWARNKNNDLFEIHDRIVRERNFDVTYEWVKGHSGNQYNERCDRMCNEAVGFDLNKEFEKYKKNKK